MFHVELILFFVSFFYRVAFASHAHQIAYSNIIMSQQNEVAVAGAVQANGQSQTKIHALDEQCWEKLLDWLSMEDVIAFSKTCKAFELVVGKYFQKKYRMPSASIDDGFLTIDFNPINFNRHVQSIFCSGPLNEQLFSSCRSLKCMYLSGVTFTESCVEHIRMVLSKVERIMLNGCDGDLYEDFLKFCVNLKCLHAYDVDIKNLLSRQYPSLKSIEIRNCGALERYKLNEFFKLNPNVRNLTIDSNFLRENLYDMLDREIQVDDLILANSNIDKLELDALNILHQRGFYKRLHIETSAIKDEIAALEGLATLYVRGIEVIPELPGLTELGFYVWTTFGEDFDVTQIPNLCKNLERLFVYESSIDGILPFIRYSPHLNEIAIRKLESNTLDISVLNNERIKLNGAQKVTIYVAEHVYLATKWSTKTINLDFIEIKRICSYEFKQPHNLSEYLI